VLAATPILPRSDRLRENFMFHGTPPALADSPHAIVDRDGSLTSAPIRVLQFGSPSRRLFGVVDEPPIDEYCGRTVVLCYPQGPDYSSAFRTFRVLATRLRNKGCRVLRFDYYGTGDSAGELPDASLEQWTADIAAAVREMTQIGATDISLVGLRLGATLAATAAFNLASINRLVLWEPVLEGAPYMSSLRSLHESWLREEKCSGRQVSSLDGDVFSEHVSPALHAEVACLNLWSLSATPPSVQLVWQSEEPHHESFASFLRDLGACVTTSRVEGPSIWSRSPLMPDPAVPNKALQSIVSFLTIA
jgi:pimeloyl-ACP methyl ester carboxylesterase